MSILPQENASSRVTSGATEIRKVGLEEEFRGQDHNTSGRVKMGTAKGKGARRNTLEPLLPGPRNLLKSLIYSSL